MNGAKKSDLVYICDPWEGKRIEPSAYISLCPDVNAWSSYLPPVPPPDDKYVDAAPRPRASIDYCDYLPCAAISKAKRRKMRERRVAIRKALENTRNLRASIPFLHGKENSVYSQSFFSAEQPPCTIEDALSSLSLKLDQILQFIAAFEPGPSGEHAEAEEVLTHLCEDCKSYQDMPSSCLSPYPNFQSNECVPAVVLERQCHAVAIIQKFARKYFFKRVSVGKQESAKPCGELFAASQEIPSLPDRVDDDDATFGGECSSEVVEDQEGSYAAACEEHQGGIGNVTQGRMRVWEFQCSCGGVKSLSDITAEPALCDVCGRLCDTVGRLSCAVCGLSSSCDTCIDGDMPLHLILHLKAKYEKNRRSSGVEDCSETPGKWAAKKRVWKPLRNDEEQ